LTTLFSFPPNQITPHSCEVGYPTEKRKQSSNQPLFLSYTHGCRTRSSPRLGGLQARRPHVWRSGQGRAGLELRLDALGRNLLLPATDRGRASFLLLAPMATTSVQWRKLCSARRHRTPSTMALPPPRTGTSHPASHRTRGALSSRGPASSAGEPSSLSLAATGRVCAAGPALVGAGRVRRGPRRTLRLRGADAACDGARAQAPPMSRRSTADGQVRHHRWGTCPGRVDIRRVAGGQGKQRKK
jgi:hypothetical protein